MFSKTKSKKGFTLIELLVVVAVIGILASIILVGLSGFRGRGRDARRIGDLRQVQNGLELYFGKNGNYPNVSDWGALTSALTTAGIGINQVPTDPSPTKAYDYCVVPVTLDRYMMVAILEEQNGAAQSVGTPPCTMSPAVTCGAASTTYCVTI